MSHAINSHILTGKKTCINQAIHVLLMHSFCFTYTHSRAIIKIDVINSNMHKSEHNLVMSGWHVFALEQVFFKILHAFAFAHH